MTIQLSDHHKRVVNYSIGSSTLRGHPKRTTQTVMDYLCTLKLEEWASQPESHSQRLDNHTVELQAKILMNRIFQDHAVALLKSQCLHQRLGREMSPKREMPLDQEEPRLKAIIGDARDELKDAISQLHQSCRKKTDSKKKLAECVLRQTNRMMNEHLLSKIRALCTPDNDFLYWGSARKSLNLFWASACYHRVLWSELNLAPLEDLLEIPLDSQVATCLEKETDNEESFWPGVQKLKRSISNEYQRLASNLCARYQCKRYELDLLFWRAEETLGGHCPSAQRG